MAKSRRTARNKLKLAMQALRRRALRYPGAWEDHPWGECVIKVNKKIFLAVNADSAALRVTAKLPHSYGAALLAPFAAPTHYGLGRSGWVTCSFGPRDAIPMDSLLAWMDESYRAIAPKKLHAAIAAAGARPKPLRRKKTSKPLKRKRLA